MSGITLQSLSSEAQAAFTTVERGDERIVVMRDDAPEWVGALVQAAHGELFPDDWRYAAIRSALGAVADLEEADDESVDDLRHEWADGYVDVYTHARLQWLASNLNRVGYVDQACEDLGIDPDAGIVERIGLGQYHEAERVFLSVVEVLHERLEDLTDELGA